MPRNPRTRAPRDLDGPEAEFPHRYVAMRAVRALWGGWLVARDPLDRDLLAYAIQDERMRICRGPGPLWAAFTDTLPGYREYQAHLVQSMFEGLFQAE
jgi:hypothetical protein